MAFGIGKGCRYNEGSSERIKGEERGVQVLKADLIGSIPVLAINLKAVPLVSISKSDHVGLRCAGVTRMREQHTV